MPLTPVALANIAMDLLGEPPITSITAPGTTMERRVARNYEQVVAEELTKRRWSFTIRHKVIQFDPSGVHPVLKRAFFLEPKILKVLRPQHVDWIVQRPFLFTNDSSPLTVPCTFRVDESEFDPLFNPIVGAALALRINSATTQSTEAENRIKAAYRNAVSEAALANAFQRGAVPRPEGAWIESARYGYPLPGGSLND